MKKTLLASLFSFFVKLSFSQSVGIGTNTPDASAQLDVFSNNKGFLPPRIALESLDLPNPISKPAPGLLVYNTDTAGVSPNNVFPGYYYWNGYMWSKISQSNSHQLNGVTIKNFSNALSSSATTFTVPAGKVWKLNYLAGSEISAFGTVPVPSTAGTDLDKYDILLDQHDSFSIAGSSYFMSIAEYPASSKSVKTFTDSVPGNATKSYIVPAHKIWKLNFFINPVGGLGVTVGNPGVAILIPNLYSEQRSTANNFLVPNTEIRVINPYAATSKYFLSISEFDE